MARHGNSDIPSALHRSRGLAFFLLPLSQSYAWPAAVLVDEFDVGCFSIKPYARGPLKSQRIDVLYPLADSCRCMVDDRFDLVELLADLALGDFHIVAVL